MKDFCGPFFPKGGAKFNLDYDRLLYSWPHEASAIALAVGSRGLRYPGDGNLDFATTDGYRWAFRQLVNVSSGQVAVLFPQGTVRRGSERRIAFYANGTAGQQEIGEVLRALHEAVKAMACGPVPEEDAIDGL